MRSISNNNPNSSQTSQLDFQANMADSSLVQNLVINQPEQQLKKIQLELDNLADAGITKGYQVAAYRAKSAQLMQLFIGEDFQKISEEYKIARSLINPTKPQMLKLGLSIDVAHAALFLSNNRFLEARTISLQGLAQARELAVMKRLPIDPETTSSLIDLLHLHSISSIALTLEPKMDFVQVVNEIEFNQRLPKAEIDYKRAVYYFAKREFNSAKVFLEACLNESGLNQNPDLSRKIDIYEKLAVCCFEQDQLEDAEQYCLNALGLIETNFGPEKRYFASLHLAQIYINRGDFDIGMRVLENLLFGQDSYTRESIAGGLQRILGNFNLLSDDQAKSLTSLINRFQEYLAEQDYFENHLEDNQIFSAVLSKLKD
jgi:hypothetical protein